LIDRILFLLRFDAGLPHWQMQSQWKSNAYRNEVFLGFLSIRKLLDYLD